MDRNIAIQYLNRIKTECPSTHNEVIDFVIDVLNIDTYKHGYDSCIDDIADIIEEGDSRDDAYGKICDYINDMRPEDVQPVIYNIMQNGEIKGQSIGGWK